MVKLKSEIEAKFLNINHDHVRGKLRAVGAVCEQPMRLMRRVVVETNEMKKTNSFVRVRDEGDKVTMTYKRFDELSVDGAKEIEIVVSDFDEAVGLVDSICPEQNRRSYQESKRETWQFGDVEIVLDEWPWIEPYIEIEGESEDDLKSVAHKLGLDWSAATFGDVMVAYRAEYPHLKLTDTVGAIEEVRFDQDIPAMLRH